MEFTSLKDFFESSTIHGLSYISTTKKFWKLFWIFVVFLAFSVAFVVIKMSFQAWDESPIKTTIETRPITELTFPSVTVCPPKNTFTNLNYDLTQIENMTISDNTRKEFRNYAIELLTEYLYIGVMKNLSQLQEKDRYHNWYHGYTEVVLPHPNNGYDVFCKINAFSTSGSVSTQHFGSRNFEFDPNILYEVAIFPGSIRNATLNIAIRKVSIKGNYEDDFTLNGEYIPASVPKIGIKPEKPVSKDLLVAY